MSPLYICLPIGQPCVFACHVLKRLTAGFENAAGGICTSYMSSDPNLQVRCFEEEEEVWLRTFQDFKEFNKASNFGIFIWIPSICIRGILCCFPLQTYVVFQHYLLYYKIWVFIHLCLWEAFKFPISLGSLWVLKPHKYWRWKHQPPSGWRGCYRRWYQSRVLNSILGSFLKDFQNVFFKLFKGFSKFCGIRTRQGSNTGRLVNLMHLTPRL